MKKKLSGILFMLFTASIFAGNVYSQANTTLSNLVSPTNINQTLTPSGNNTLNLGSTARSWRFLYIDSQIYIKDLRAIHSRGTGNFFTGQNAGNLTLTGSYNAAFGQSALPVLTSGGSNVALGFSAMYSNTTGLNNTATGVKALNFNTTGRHNTATGYRALYSNTVGFSNVAIGINALNSSTSASNLVAVGDSALFSNTTAGNTAIGSKAMYTNTTGGFNVAVGLQSLYANTDGYYNTAVGSTALYRNSNGYYNTGLGGLALYNNTSGYYNSAVGYAALYSNTTGQANVAHGFYALESNTTGTSNTAIGYYSMYLNSTANYTTALGAFTLYQNTTGTGNTATGYYALGTNSTGSYNTANGYYALGAATTGGYHTAVGYQAMYTTGACFSNTAVGNQAMYSNTTGGYNTAVGLNGLYSNTTGQLNTALGFVALSGNTTGTNNTALGAYADISSGTFTNATAIGYGAIAAASNQVMLGNTSVNSVKAAGSFVIYSDGRFKKDIQANVPGLDFIRQLRPVTYHYNVHGMNEKMGAKDLKEKAMAAQGDKFPSGSTAKAALEKLDEDAIITKEKKLYTGFVAQEVETAASKLNYDFSGVYKPQNDKDLYGLSYSDFVVPLVKAVQELSTENDELKKTNASLESRIEKLEALMKLSSAGNVKLENGMLEQNIPNPVKGSTTIAYQLPSKYTAATIVITDVVGKKLKSINISGGGRGTLNLDAAGLASGTYQYTLYVDKRMVDSKQLVIVR